MCLQRVPRERQEREKRGRRRKRGRKEEKKRKFMGWIFYLTVITSLEAHWSPQAKENSYDWKVIQHAHMLIGWLNVLFLNRTLLLHLL